MLFKLTKYNLQSIFKSILPFLILFFFSVVFFNLTNYDIELIYDDSHLIVAEIPSSEFLQFLHGLASFMISCSPILLAASTLKAIWRRFKINFFSDEAYLTHTLPIPRSTLWNAQILSVLITFASLALFLVLNCFILMLTPDGQKLLDSFGLLGGCAHCVGQYHYIEPLELSFYLSFILTIFAEFTFMTFCGMTGIILKNRYKKNIAIVSGCAIYLFGGMALIGLFLLISHFDPDILRTLNGMPFRTPGFDFDTSYFDRAFFYIGTIYTVFSAAMYFINRKLLAKGIDLD